MAITFFDRYFYVSIKYGLTWVGKIRIYELQLDRHVIK